MTALDHQMAERLTKRSEHDGERAATGARKKRDVSIFEPDMPCEVLGGALTRQLEVLALRSIELADRVAAGKLRFLDAIDLAYEAAVWAGLPEAIDKSGLITGILTGDDIVQATLAAAFANARRPA
jgi:hypothetical protein